MFICSEVNEVLQYDRLLTYLEKLFKTAPRFLQHDSDVFQSLFLPLVSCEWSRASFHTDRSVGNGALYHFHCGGNDTNIPRHKHGAIVNGGLREQVGLESFVRRHNLLGRHLLRLSLWVALINLTGS